MAQLLSHKNVQIFWQTERKFANFCLIFVLRRAIFAFLEVYFMGFQKVEMSLRTKIDHLNGLKLWPQKWISKGQYPKRLLFHKFYSKGNLTRFSFHYQHT